MKYVKNILILLFLLLLIPIKVNAAKDVNVYLFYGDGCPHCEKEYTYLKSIKDKYNLKIYRYEVWYNEDNKELMKKTAKYLDVEVSGVPFTVINNSAIIGFNESITPDTILYNIKSASKSGFVDEVGIRLGVVEKPKTTKANITTTKKEQKRILKLPIVGKVDLKSLSLPVISILIGLVDGFNPCALWVLLFLISTLIGMKDKKRLWILGLTFLITSALVYLGFMLSWLKFTDFINTISWVRYIIALVALIGGCVSLKSFANSLNNDGCTVIDDKKRKSVFKKIKKFTHEKNFIFALLGVVLLAGAVNVIELACSAGLPVVFTEILSINKLSSAEYFLYIFLYILFFMIDDIIIFFVSIKTFEVTGISTKYSKYSHLIGGIIMIIISLLLVFKPEWIMFNF